MDIIAQRRGRRELAHARRKMRRLLAAVALFSGFVNLLMLTGPLYMLNVYDRVLGSQSVETLVALSVLAAFLFMVLGLLDSARARIMARAAARLQQALSARVFRAALQAGRMPSVSAIAGRALRDLDAVHRLLSAQAFLTLHDLPFTPLFLAAIFLFHPLLGAFAIASAAALVLLALATHLNLALPLEEAGSSALRADGMAAQMQQEGETIAGVGMLEATLARWQEARVQALVAGLAAADTGSGLGATVRALRLFVQSAMLGLGAFLVIRGELGAGAMIAASILLGRALAPVEAITGQWALFARAREGWGNLALLLGSVPVRPAPTALPRPEGRLSVEGLTVLAPGGQVVLRGISFAAGPGDVVGVIGPSGAGKSALARALVGVWPAAQGAVRLDGATLSQYGDGGGQVGYLPQQVTLFEASLRDNIARLAAEPDSEAVIRAAQMAGAHEMILRLPEGYDTRADTCLSSGQRQRIGLARALLGDPALLVLDEPDSSLDSDGLRALAMTLRRLRAAGTCTVAMTHRPALLQECNLVLVIEDGRLRAFGPRDEVLRRVLANVTSFEASERAAAS